MEETTNTNPDETQFDPGDPENASPADGATPEDENLHQPPQVQEDPPPAKAPKGKNAKALKPGDLIEVEATAHFVYHREPMSKGLRYHVDPFELEANGLIAAGLFCIVNDAHRTALGIAQIPENNVPGCGCGGS